MNDAPRRWWNILDKGPRTYGMIPTRADRCCLACCILCSHVSKLGNHWGQRAIAQQSGAEDAFTESHEQPELEAAFEKKRWIPMLDVQVQEKPWQVSSIYLWRSSWNRWKRNGTTCSDQTQKMFSSWNDVAFTRQRIRWTQDSQHGTYIEVGQKQGH